jgi:hypothetical protein
MDARGDRRDGGLKMGWTKPLPSAWPMGIDCGLDLGQGSDVPGSYLTATRGLGAPEARICYERAEPLCHSLGRPLLLYVALIGRWRYSLITDKLSAAMQVAERVYSLAQEQDDPALMIWACNVLAATLYFLGDFKSARQYAMRAVQIWRSGGGQSPPEDVDTPIVGSLCYKALSEWHLGETASCKAKLDEAISVNDLR